MVLKKSSGGGGCPYVRLETYCSDVAGGMLRPQTSDLRPQASDLRPCENLAVSPEPENSALLFQFWRFL